MVSARKEDLKERARSLVADLRNAALLAGKTTADLQLRFDTLEKKLVADFCGQAAAWYTDNVKYKGAFQGLLRAVADASTQIHDTSSVLCKSLAALIQGEAEVPKPVAAATSGAGSSTSTSNKVAEMHRKFHTDLGWTGARGKFYGDEVYRQGVAGLVGPMPRQLLRSIYAEHKQAKDSEAVFTAWNAGLKIDTTPSDEFDFVVGVEVWCPSHFQRHISCVTNCTNRKKAREAGLYYALYYGDLSRMFSCRAWILSSGKFSSTSRSLGWGRAGCRKGAMQNPSKC